MQFLLTGGAACGKSTYAEKLVQTFPPPYYYLATMRPRGDAAKACIARHRAQRSGKGFTTIERYTDLAGVRLPARGTVLLECLSTLTANELFDPDGAGESAVEAVLAGVAHLERQAETLVVVTNEVGSDGAAYTAEVQRYIAAIGAVSRALVARFPCVYELCCGIPIPLKGTLPRE